MTTGQGSKTPTQIECLQDAIVCFTQSSVSTARREPVSNISSRYRSIEMKYGWVHSAYKKSSILRSCMYTYKIYNIYTTIQTYVQNVCICSTYIALLTAAVKGFSRSSRWHHVAMTMRPPGFSTRAISSTYLYQDVYSLQGY